MKMGERFYSAATDISGQRESEAALVRSEAFFRSVFEQAAVGVAVVDSNSGQFVLINRRYCDIIGASEEDLLATDVQRITHPDDMPAQLASMERMKRGEIAMFTMEKRYVRPGGQVVWVNLSVAPLWLPGEPPSSHVAMVQDITAVKQIEEALRDLNRTLESRVETATRAKIAGERMLVQQSKMAAMGEMLGAIAHQWRQPLNAVGIITQDIRDAFEAGRLDGAYLRQAVDDSLAQLRFMSRTIEDFRNFFRPDKAAATFDVKRALAEAFAMVEVQLDACGIEWTIVCEAHGKTFGPGQAVDGCESVPVTGFENELKQVFLNLIDNAKDAIAGRPNAPAPERGWIRADVGQRNDRVEIRVTDNGGGIPEAILGRIFEPYFTTKDDRHGSGVGLYMAKMIVESHMNGRLTARNTGDGAEFAIGISPKGGG